MPTPQHVPRKLIEMGIGIPRVFVAPEGETDIGDLHSLWLEDAHAMLTQTESVNHKMVTWWSFDQVERERVKQGIPLRVVILGPTSVNPMQIDVANDLEGILFGDGSKN